MTEIRIKTGIQVIKKDTETGTQIINTPQAWTIILQEGKASSGLEYKKTDPQIVRKKLHEALDTMLEEAESVWNGK